jgi:phosphoglycolate phosphatase
MHKTLVSLHPVTPLGPVLSGLLESRYLLGLATNDAKRATRLTLEKLAIDDLFDQVFGHDTGHGAKPESGMNLEFC